MNVAKKLERIHRKMNGLKLDEAVKEKKISREEAKFFKKLVWAAYRKFMGNPRES